MERFDFVNRANADYIDRLYAQYQRDPRSLDLTWQAYFAGFDYAAGRGAQRPPQKGVAANDGNVHPGRAAAAGPGMNGAATAPGARPELSGNASIGIFDLVHSFRELGHFVANLDPLGHNRSSHPLLELGEFNLTPADLDRAVGSGSFHGPTDGTLRSLIEKLRETYCRTLGVQFMEISDKAQRDWLAQRMEPILNRPAFSPEESRAILFQLLAAEEFERFLHTRFVGAKRFSLEGAESLIPLINAIADDGASLGVDEFCIGMPHRGRLNVLAHVLNKPYEVIFSEFKGTILHHDQEGDGDVKYHLGYANDRPTPQGRSLHLGLSPNPSHLELINPVVSGIVRAKQYARGDKDMTRVVPMLIHGDAAFTGQGIVFETLNLSELPGFRAGGTIHLIVNNQVGFTTNPGEGRFTPYPTDVAKMIQAPIFHVNGDDPEAVVWASKLAVAFRQQFKCDVMIDLICYRRHGHNEVDEPSFTQPVMYKQIATHRSVRELYAERLMREGKLTEQQHADMTKVVRERMESAFKLAEELRPRQRTATINNLWKGLTRVPSDWSAKTGVARNVLSRIADAVNVVPPDFTVHPKLKRLYAARQEAVKTGKGIDWGNAEMLSLGSLLLEGTPVRFTGQDVRRGTFSHRHAVLFDYNNGNPHFPLNHVTKEQAKLTILNTMLSELAVLGFEYGFSSGDPRNLVLWEAQFGDFVNGAQPIIDQFITAAESKWSLFNGMVMLLPHGFEGQGPEHSNAYLERFLSLCAEDNIQVCVPTTPAQYFHMLRRQIHRKFRKPLVVLTPKSLLRFEPSFSRIEELTDGAMQNVLDDPAAPAERDRVRRLLLCSGKVYYSLAQAREKEGLKDVAIVRVEQLYPFPKKELQAVFQKYRNAHDVTWVQEEPKNKGAWSFMEARLRDMLPETAVLSYTGRDEAASPATGSFKMHQIEEAELIAHALDLKPPAAAPAAAAGKDKEVGAGGPPASERAPLPPAPPAARQAAVAAPATAGSQHPVSD
jgi:2-oxoglutarate dehydrogenase E1 component